MCHAHKEGAGHICVHTCSHTHSCPPGDTSQLLSGDEKLQKLFCNELILLSTEL